MGRFRVWARLVATFRRSHVEAQLARELASHLALLEDELVRRGMSPTKARREARLRLGAEATRHAHRDACSFRWIDELRIDIRQARRALFRHWLSTTAGILIVGVVGIANALVFGLADAVLFPPLPYRDAERVFVDRMLDEQSGRHFTRVPNDVLQLLESSIRTNQIGLIENGSPRIVLDTEDGPQAVATARTNSDYLAVLGVVPAAGRLFTAQGEESSEQVAMLSRTAWLRYFGGREDVVGTRVRLGDTTLHVAGLLPSNTFFPTLFGDAPDVLVAASLPNQEESEAAAFNPVVRLDPGTSAAELNAALAAGARARRSPGARAVVPVLQPVRDILFPTGRTIMHWLLACTLTLTLLAGVNLSGHFLVRRMRQAREDRLRLALGASRSRIVRPILIEVAAISVLALVGTLAVAGHLFEPLLTYVPRVVYHNAPVGIDARVVVITAGAIAFVAVPTTLLVAWRTIRPGGGSQGSDAGDSRRASATWRRGRALVAIQIALSVVLVFGATITARAFRSLLEMPLGFNPAGVVSISISPFRSAYDYAEILRVLNGQPDIVAAGAVGQLPFDGSGPAELVETPAGNRFGLTHVLPGYFEAIRQTLVAGRLFTWADFRGDRTAVVLSRAAARLLADDDQAVLGRTLTNSYGRELRVVGVVGDAVYAVGAEPPSTIFALPHPSDLNGWRGTTIVVRTAQQGGVSLREVRELVRGVVPGTRVSLEWWADLIANVTAFRNPRFQTMILSSLGAIALLLTAIGIMAALGSLIASRARELAVRAAMGATPGSLMRLTASQALAPVLVGMAAGLVATRWAAGFAEAQLFAVDTTGAAGLLVTVAIVSFAALVAVLIPSRKAMRADPAAVLKGE